MLEPWNNATLLPPPINVSVGNSKVDIPGLHHACNNIIRVLSKQSPLHNESALCSRFLYKYDKKFRHDIGYRNLKKVNTALRKYLTLNLLKDVDNFLSALPSADDDEVYLPTRQMLEYVLVRTITFSKIMLRICVCSKQAAIFYLNRIKRGESHWMSLLPYAHLSRLWSMCMVLLQHSCSWYSSLHSYLKDLQLKGLPFLPVGFELPLNLELWLELKDIDCFGKFKWAEKKQIKVNTTAIDDNEIDMMDNILGYVNQTNEKEEQEINTQQEIKIKPLSSFGDIQFSISNVKQLDQGEVLSRESFKFLNNPSMGKKESETLLNITPYKNSPERVTANLGDIGETLSRETFKAQNQSKFKRDSKKHSHHTVTDVNSLNKFIEQEEIFRNNSDNQSLTSHLTFMQWQALKKSLLQLCDTITNRKIEKKFQKIWKQKCLDYME